MAAGGFNGEASSAGQAFSAGRAIGLLARRAGAVAALLLPAVAFTSTDGRAQEIVAGDLVLEQPWARATPAGAKVAGGYLVIRNTGDTADRLVSGAMSFAERLEVHQMSLADGVMTMRQLPDGLEIPPGEDVALQPGSYHLMFVGLTSPLAVDTVATVKLTFERAGTVDVPFAVAPIGATRPGAAGPGHGAEHDAGHSESHSGDHSGDHSGGSHTDGH